MINAGLHVIDTFELTYYIILNNVLKRVVAGCENSSCSIDEFVVDKMLN